MRCFMVPRGSTLLAGGPAHPDSKQLTLQAEVGSETYGILSNQYLAVKARTTLYQATITIDGPDQFTYEETTTVELAAMDEPFLHTDRNVMRRVPS